jgi:flagellar hook-associated protein 1 FlgK
MSGLFSTFNIVKRGMVAQQTALQVVSHNVANANTEGYSVQRADLKTTEPFGMPSISSAGSVGQLGTGAQVASITRARDIFLDGQIRKEQSTVSNYKSREEFLSEIETIFMEPSDTGLSTNLSKYWDSWNQLAMNPESSAARTLVVGNGDDLATSIRHTYEQLSDMEVNAGGIIKNQIFETNDILQQIKDLNEQIKAVVVSGMQPNDLLDRRDVLLNQLSENFSFDTTQTDFQGIEIAPKAEGYSGSIVKDSTVNNTLAYISGWDSSGGKLNLNMFAEGDSDLQFPVNLDFITDKDLIISIANVDLNPDGSIASVIGLKTHAVFSTYDKNQAPPLKLIQGAQFKDGSLNGYEAIKTDIEDYKSRLNKLARALAVTVNTIHSNNSADSDIAANSSMNFFVSVDENDIYLNDPTGTSKTVKAISEIESIDEPAKNIQVNKRFIDDVSALDAGKNASGDGNGERATLIGSLRNLRIDIQGITRNTFLQENFGLPSVTTSTDLTQVTTNSKTGGFTIDSYFKDAISKLGVDSQQAQKMVTNQGALLAQLETRRESISGVSLDEEMTNMLQFQRSYEANAKMISVIDQLLDVVVNGLIK